MHDYLKLSKNCSKSVNFGFGLVLTTPGTTVVRILEILVYMGNFSLTWRHNYSADDNVLIRDRYPLLELYNVGLFKFRFNLRSEMIFRDEVDRVWHFGGPAACPSLASILKLDKTACNLYQFVADDSQTRSLESQLVPNMFLLRPKC